MLAPQGSNKNSILPDLSDPRRNTRGSCNRGSVVLHKKPRPPKFQNARQESLCARHSTSGRLLPAAKSTKACGSSKVEPCLCPLELSHSAACMGWEPCLFLLKPPDLCIFFFGFSEMQDGAVCYAAGVHAFGVAGKALCCLSLKLPPRLRSPDRGALS